MKLGDRLTLLFLSLATLMVIMTWVTLRNTNTLIGEHKKLFHRDIPFLITFTEWNQHILQRQHLEVLYLIFESQGLSPPEGLLLKRRQLEMAYVESQLAVERYIERETPQLASLFHKVASFPPAISSKSLVDIWEREREFQKNLSPFFQKVVQFQSQHLQRHNRMFLSKTLRLQQVNFFAMVVALLLSLFLGLLTSRQIVQPLRALQEGALAVAKGNLEVTIPVSRQDELGEAISLFNSMVQKLRETTVHAASLNQIIQVMHHYILFLDLRGDVQEVNDSLLRDLGYEKEELLAEPFAYLLASPNPLLVSQLLQGKVRQQETEFQGKYGQKVAVLVSAAKLSPPFRNVSLVVTAQNIEERKKLEKKIVETSDQERRRLAQELHDGLGQELVGIKFMIEALANKLSGGGSLTVEDLKKVAQLLEQSIQNAKSMARNLSSLELERQGLVSALEDFLLHLGQVYSIECEFHCLLPDPFPADQKRDIHLYRIVQEATQNSIRHGQATKITVVLDETREFFRLQILDNGKGFIPYKSKTKGMGLTFMEYRSQTIGGILEIHSRLGEGTQVICLFPKVKESANGKG